MPDFLLELLSEEIPARMQERARADLARLFADEIGKAGLKAERIETYSTPRRLALIARGLPAGTEAVREELKGPRTSAPPQALEGFLRKTGLAREQLEERDGVFFAVIDKPGRATASVLADAIPAIVRAFPWPKSMRWGAASISTESLRWVRPLHGIVALFGGEIVPCAIDGIASGAETVGHRFHHPGRITIGSADDYAAKLRACHVIVDQDERRAIIAEGARAAAEAAGLMLVEDEGLLTENAGLTEWPVPLLGHFDPAFLEVPREVIQLTMRTNQKYFALLKASPERGGGPAKPVEGAPGHTQAEAPLHHQPSAGGPPPRAGEELQLAPNFVCVANIEAHDSGRAIVAGNEKVLAARLSDAKFFWEQDLKIPLDEQAQKLDQIVFHEKLGTVADKVERVAKLARWLVEEGIVKSSPANAGEGDHAKHGGGARSAAEGSSVAYGAGPSTTGAAGGPPPLDKRGEELADLAETAARLCKADLVTGMVGEFPELQGVMGGYYARAQGYPSQVADAIRDHYKPVGQGDEVPTAPVTVAVSLADKLDTLMAFFAIGQTPTGSKDPFALRRAALGVASLILDNGLRVGLQEFFTEAAGSYFPTSLAKRHEGVANLEDHRMEFDESFWEEFEKLFPFLVDRLKVQQREAGVRHDLIDAVFALGGEDDLVRLLARVKALQAFVETPEGADLLAGYKRAANILKKEGWASPSPLAGEGDSRIGASGEHRVDHAPHGRGTAGGSSDPMLGTERSEASVDGSGPSPSHSPDGERAPPSPEMGEGLVQGIPQTGEEDPFVMAEALRDAIVGHEKRLSYTPEPEEAQLIAALDSAEPLARAAVEREDFEGAMAALATLRAPVDAFFDKVTVNDPDPAKRAARLNLLARMRDAVHRVADFSKIEG